MGNSNAPQLFKSFEFGNGSRMSNKNLAILEFKYLQNKKWLKKAIKSARIKMSYRTFWLFSFHSSNWYKLGNFQHFCSCFCSTSEAPWMQIFVFLQPMQRQKKMVFLILEHCSCWGVKQKKHKNIIKFWPLNPYVHISKRD